METFEKGLQAPSRKVWRMLGGHDKRLRWESAHVAPLHVIAGLDPAIHAEVARVLAVILLMRHLPGFARLPARA